MKEELPSSTQYFQKKFQKWFGNPVPADPSFQTEVGHSIDELDTNHLPFPAEAYYLYYQTTCKSRYDMQKLMELISFGFIGAVLLGIGVGFIILMMNISFLGRYGINWPNQFVVIFLAMAIGFLGGLFKRSIDMVREKYSFKDRF